MRIRRAATLVCTFEGAKPVVHNFLKKEMFECNARTLDIFARLDDWLSMEDALDNLPGPLDASTELLKELIARDLLLLEGSPQAERDQHYRDNWRWGAVAAFYHFSLRDSKFIGGEAMVERLRSFGGPSASPPLLTSNEGLEKIVELPAFDLDEPFFAALHRRRSRREFSQEAISRHALADCLYAGNGVKEMLDAGEYGRLPLTMTPSGGARNPFELYVMVRKVAGLEAGIYHYSAAEHTLGFLHDRLDIPPRELLGDQGWADGAAAIVFLAATFERSAWKYRQALAYRVVLMEAGAITQNIQLAAAHHGVDAAPTGALAESAVEELLGLVPVTQAVLFAIALGAQR